MTNPTETRLKMDVEERYRILIQARNFHYENFSKWMTYFYVAIGAVFVGYCTILSAETKQPDTECMLTVLGFVMSLFWYWSAKGYYYWNINFITLVNYYEKDILKFNEKERVYLVFANKKTQNNYLNPISGANISTSKIAILFAFIISTAWGYVMAGRLQQYLNWSMFNYPILKFLFTVMLVLAFSNFIPFWFLKSKHEHFPDLKLR